MHQHSEEDERELRMVHCFPLCPPEAIDPLRQPQASTAVRSSSLWSVSGYYPSKDTGVFKGNKLVGVFAVYEIV